MSDEVAPKLQWYQCSLRSLFLATFVFALFCALAVMSLEQVAAMLILAGWAGFCWGLWFGKPLLMVVSVAVLLVGWGWSDMLQSREGGRQAKCLNNVKEISTAIFCYAVTNDEYPPPYIADESGKPMHSWRVLILPQLGYQKLYDQYRFDEPWDGPNNRKLADKCPRVFQCPTECANRRSPSVETSYVAIVGPKTIWSGDRAVIYDSIVNASGTILLVEVANSGINWMEPRDLHIEEAVPSSEHPNIVAISFADGHARRVSKPELRTFLSRHADVSTGELDH